MIWMATEKPVSTPNSSTQHERTCPLIAHSCLDYVWIDPEDGEIRVMLNHRPNDGWEPAGNEGGRIGKGGGPGKTIFLAV
jgi:hypothetical protein